MIGLEQVSFGCTNIIFVDYNCKMNSWLKYYVEAKFLIESKIMYTKIYFKIDQHCLYYDECIYNPTPFLCSQLITPFLDSIIYTNQEIELEFQPIVEPLFFLSSVESLFLHPTQFFIYTQNTLYQDIKKKNVKTYCMYSNKLDIFRDF